MLKNLSFINHPYPWEMPSAGALPLHPVARAASQPASVRPLTPAGCSTVRATASGGLELIDLGQHGTPRGRSG